MAVKEMTKSMRARYTLEFKQEAVRLVEWGQGILKAHGVLFCALKFSYGRGDE
jgi:hypothetical protein